MLSLTLVAAGIGLLIFGGDRLVEASIDLARRARLTPAFIGLTVVAAGTSMPELFVSATAALAGSPGIALGNVIGSNIANVGLILGLCAMVAPLPVGAGIMRLDYPVLVGVSIGVPLLGLDGWLGRWDSALCVLALSVYVGVAVALARRTLPVQADSQAGAAPARSIGPMLAWLVAALVCLAVGARVLVIGAVQIAHALGVSERVVGLTIVAVGTSLPELVASAAAALKQQQELAVANIVGSNIFNLLGILGVTGLIQPLPTEAGKLNIDVPVMIGFALALLPLARDERVSRLEGALLVLLYAGYLLMLARPGSG